LPDKLELQIQVVSIPRSFTMVLDEHDGVSAISRNKPRVWSTNAVSGDSWGVPRVMKEDIMFFSKAILETAVDDLNFSMKGHRFSRKKMSAIWENVSIE